MTCEQLAALLMKAAGGVPPVDMRPRLAALNSGKSSIELRYEWVKDFSIIEQIIEKSHWQLSDGAEWFSLFVNN